MLSRRRDHGDDGLHRAEILIEANRARSTCQGDSPPDRRKPALFLATGSQYLPKQSLTTGRVAGAWHARRELPAWITVACGELLAGWARSGGTRRGPGRGRAGEHRTYRVPAAMLEQDVARSGRAGAAAEIHDALTSGATAAVTLVREDLVEFEPGRVARWTGRGCAGATYATRCARR